MQWFLAVVLVAILGVAAMAAAGRMGELSRDPVRDTYRQDLPSERPLSAADLQGLRFGITLRGYAMGQVDDLLDRLTAEIAERDATIERLSSSPSPVQTSPEPDPLRSAHVAGTRAATDGAETEWGAGREDPAEAAPPLYRNEES
jgi:DivIVA domain-containing protein